MHSSSYGTQNTQMEISHWCTAQACGNSIGATPSSPSSMLTTPCCWCLVSTSARTTRRQEKLPSSVWVEKTKSMPNGYEVIFVYLTPSSKHATENYTLLSRVRNKPYDVFGCWLNETHLISGNLHWIGNMTSCSVLWLNKAFQVSALVTSKSSKKTQLIILWAVISL